MVFVFHICRQSSFAIFFYRIKHGGGFLEGHLNNSSHGQVLVRKLKRFSLINQGKQTQESLSHVTACMAEGLDETVQFGAKLISLLIDMILIIKFERPYIFLINVITWKWILWFIEWGKIVFIVRISKQLFLFLGNRKILCHYISTFRVTGFSDRNIFHFSVKFGRDCYWNYLPYLQIGKFCLKFSSAENVILLITIVHHLELLFIHSK